MRGGERRNGLRLAAQGGPAEVKKHERNSQHGRALDV